METALVSSVLKRRAKFCAASLAGDEKQLGGWARELPEQLLGVRRWRSGCSTLPVPLGVVKLPLCSPSPCTGC